jgi:hypothetical protein
LVEGEVEKRNDQTPQQPQQPPQKYAAKEEVRLKEMLFFESMGTIKALKIYLPAHGQKVFGNKGELGNQVLAMLGL